MSIWDAPAREHTFVVCQVWEWKLLGPDGERIDGSDRSFEHRADAFMDLAEAHKRFPAAWFAEEREVDSDE